LSKKPKAVVLLSGGLDSATVLAIALEAGFAVLALTFRYGQRHQAEIAAAGRVARAAAVEKHVIAEIDLRAFGGSALTDDIEVPKDRKADEIGGAIPVTYVPARNTIFLSHALAFAEVEAAHDIFIGVNALDYSGYPDCRGEYIDAFEVMANLATKASVEGKRKITIRVPVIKLNKAGIIRKGLDLGVDYGLTMSCYDPGPDGAPCGRCDACLLRLKGFEEAGVADPLCYSSGGGG
jgi:7-cyano-7-deazaguanine synthase